jgi:citrate/tricarballylate utilization protein
MHTDPGAFYEIVPLPVMLIAAGVVFVYALTALLMEGGNFWRDAGAGALRQRPLMQAIGNALLLSNLGGGGDGCNYPDEGFSAARRWLHHAMFYGFLLCFAATCVATLYHYGLGLRAPNARTSLPVLLGIAGGIGLLAGPAGLFWLNLRRDPQPGDPAQKPMDLGFIALLFLSSLTGLALMAWRDGAAMAPLLAVHLGIVMALFLTLPYGKFAHGAYRSAALLKWAIEKRQPSRLQLRSE